MLKFHSELFNTVALSESVEPPSGAEHKTHRYILMDDYQLFIILKFLKFIIRHFIFAPHIICQFLYLPGGSLQQQLGLVPFFFSSS